MARLGVTLTVLYVSALGVFLFSHWSDLTQLKLNELGDLVAGTVSPLALGWLVLGFFQQGRELQNSVRALQLQTKELKASVEQQTALVSITKEQHDLDYQRHQADTHEARIASLPDFSVVSTGGISDSHGVRSGYKLVNRGAYARHVVIEMPGYLEKTIKQDVNTDGDRSFTIENARWPRDWRDAHLIVEATARSGLVRTQVFDESNAKPELISDDPAAAN
ncbi:MAG: hypothetical protein AAF330_02640 [Pseudomonadota bacterium]